MVIRINLYPRVHLSLISMRIGGYRENGGIGFSLQDPRCYIEATPNSSIEIRERREDGFTKSELRRHVGVLESARKRLSLRQGVRISISGPMPTHCGFGSTTAVRLACLEALCVLNNVSLPQRELVELSRRGGTSGIGIETYFHGGFVCDLGHSPSLEHPRPSSQAEVDASIPLTLIRTPMPDWEWGILIPGQVDPLTEDQERAFFRETPDLSLKEVEEILYHAIFGVTTGVLEPNRTLVAEAIRALRGAAWKRREIAVYGDRVESIIGILEARGAEVVTMSSLGPALVFLASNLTTVCRSENIPHANDATFYVTHPRNDGREIINGGV